MSDTCPECGSQMVLRVSNHNEEAWPSFYQCVLYPSCLGFRDVEQDFSEPMQVPLVTEISRPDEPAPDWVDW